MHLFSTFNILLISILLTKTLFGSFEEELKLIDKVSATFNEDVRAALVGKDDTKIQVVDGEGDRFETSIKIARNVLSINEFGRILRQDDSHRGHHPTLHMANCFFKSDVVLPPLDPCMEKFAFYFQTLLFKRGIPYSQFYIISQLPIQRYSTTQSYTEEELMNIVNGEESKIRKENAFITEAHIFQASQFVKGQNLKMLLKKVDAKEADCSFINEESFGEHVICELILNPGDHKPENFIIQDDGSLVCVDNDLLLHFSKFEYLDKPAFGGVKSILYLMPLMNLPIHESIKARLLSIDPNELVHNLTILIAKDESKFSIEQELLLSFLNKFYIPLRFPYKTDAFIIERFREIKRFISHSTVTYNQLFQFLEPKLFDYYQQILSSTDLYLAAIQLLYKGECPLNGKSKPLSLDIIKGRWLTNRLMEIKSARDFPLESCPEKLPSELRFVNSVPVTPLKIKDHLLMNADNPILREAVCSIFLSQFSDYSGLTEYPYQWLLDYLKNHPESLPFIKSLFCSQKAYECIVSDLVSEKNTEFIKEVLQLYINDEI